MHPYRNHYRKLTSSGTLAKLSMPGQLTESQRIGHLAMALATFVGQFIKFHPFINGNGRENLQHAPGTWLGCIRDRAHLFVRSALYS